MATIWESWLDEVMPDLPGAPAAALVKNAIRNAATEFCDRTWVWRVPHPAPISVIAGTAEYAFVPPANTKVVKAHRVWYDGLEIAPQTPENLSSLYAQWTTETGTPLYFTQRDPEKLLLIPIPEADLANAITAEIAIKPARAAVDIETTIYEKYLEEIAYGAKARMFAMKAKPWSDAKLAAFNLGMFDQAIGRAKVPAAKGHTRARLRVKPHFY